jgi:cephalosporin-C deacetylase
MKLNLVPPRLPFLHSQFRFVPLHRLGFLWVLLSLLGITGSAADSKPRLVVTSDHPDAVYQVGELIRWRVEAEPPGRFTEVSYRLKRDGMTTILEGKLMLTNGSNQIEARLSEPATLLLEIRTKGPDDRQVTGLGGAVAAPERIQPSSTRPLDFDAFWRAKLEDLSKVPANPQLTQADCGKPDLDYWHLIMDNINDTKLRGQLARPKSGDKLPAILIVQWAGVYPLDKGWVTDPAGSGWLALNINAHDLPIDEAPEFYQKQSEGPLKDYPAIGNDNRETSYFLRMYLSCYRAAQYLTERPDWDGRTLLVTGGSQGGLQALMTAGLHPKVTAAIACVPAGCDFTGPDAGRSPGWPGWYWSTNGKNPAKVREASRYYDVVNFASRINCPVLVALGLIDVTCPPAGIFAALNQVKGPKEILIMPKGEHQDQNGAHQPFYSRSGAWKSALVRGHAAPVPDRPRPQ